MNVYDPNFEQDLNQISQSDVNSGDYIDTQTGGFINPDASVSNSAPE
jgi:hypothetical protein